MKIKVNFLLAVLVVCKSIKIVKNFLFCVTIYETKYKTINKIFVILQINVLGYHDNESIKGAAKI